MNDGLISIRQAGAAFGLHPDTIRRWIREGRLPAYGGRGYLRVRISELMRKHGRAGASRPIGPDPIDQPSDGAISNAWESGARQQVALLDKSLQDAIGVAHNLAVEHSGMREVAESLRAVRKRIQVNLG